jgi:hypothetical protein
MEREGIEEDSNISDLTKSVGADGSEVLASKEDSSLVELPSDAVQNLGSKHTTNTTNLSWADQSDDADEKGDANNAVANAEDNASTKSLPKKHMNSDHMI